MGMTSAAAGIRALALAMPLVFVLHVAEEAPGFVSWFNSIASPRINQSMFLAVNAWALLITVAVVAVLLVAPGPGSGLVAVAWVGLLMLANGLFHVVATVVHARYCPGVVTGLVLYMPFGLAFVRAIKREYELSIASVIVAGVIGAVPMVVHGYLIVFRSSRLF